VSVQRPVLITTFGDEAVWDGHPGRRRVVSRQLRLWLRARRLHDLFSNPPFVADPEFTSLEFDALRCKWTQKSSRSLDTPKSIFLNIDSAQLTFLVWFFELILVLFSLIIVS
jgi:hypothetical protein